MSETTDRSDADNAAMAENCAASAISSSSNDSSVATDVPGVQVQGLCRTETQIYTETTDSYLDELEGMIPPSPMEIERDLVKRTQAEFIIENRLREPGKEDQAVSKGILLTLPQRLANMQVAMIVKRLHYVRAVQLSETDRDSSLLAIYEVGGLNEGLYVTSEMDMYRVVAQYNLSIDMRSFIEVQQILHREALLAPVSNGDPVKHLSVLANGIWNHQLQKLEPFTPGYVFLTRTPATEYDENAQNVQVEMSDGGMWDVESWVEEPHDDPEIRDQEPFSVAVLKDRIHEALADESFTHLDGFLDVAISHSVLAEECGQGGREITYAMMRDGGTGGEWLEVSPSDQRLASRLGKDFMMDAVEEAIERNLALEAGRAKQSQATASTGTKGKVSAEPVPLQVTDAIAPKPIPADAFDHDYGTPRHLFLVMDHGFTLEEAKASIDAWEAGRAAESNIAPEAVVEPETDSAKLVSAKTSEGLTRVSADARRRSSSSGLGDDFVAQIKKLLDGDFGDAEETPVVSDEVQQLPKAPERGEVVGRATKVDNRKHVSDQCTVDQATTQKVTKAPPTKSPKLKGVNFDRLGLSALDQLDDSTVQNDGQEYGG